MSDRTLSEQVAIRLGWSEPGSYNSTEHYKKHYPSPGKGEDLFKGFWLDPKGRAFRRTRPTNYSTDIAACFRDIVPKFLERGLRIVIIGAPDMLYSAHYFEDGTRNLRPVVQTGWVPSPAEAICRAFLSMEEK